MRAANLAENDIFSGVWRRVAFALAIVIALAHLYFVFSADVSELGRNALHFAGFGLLAALVYPIFGAGKWRWLDLLFGALVAWAAIHAFSAEDAIYARGVRLSPWDWCAGGVLIVAAIELTRRTAGLVIPVLIVLALSYVAFWGQYLGGVFRFPGLSLETLMFRSLYGDDALFGNIARISSTYVFLFILFGAFLLRSGAGEFIVQLARAVAGRMVGGPGFIAVIASALTGTISGSAVANTASTGVLTIPLMKRAGFSAKFAGGVETAASTGGQLMPPIMGAGAFVMVSYTNIAYERIIVAALLPALLYFASVAFMVRIEARKQGLRPDNSDNTSFKQAFKNGGLSFVLPISLLISLLMLGFTPEYAAVISIVAIVASSWLGAQPMGWREILEAMALGAKNMIGTAVLLCAVGLIVNVIATAGVGNTFSLMISTWASGNIILAIALIALASLVLGMGLPVTAAYIVLATLSAPALAGMISDSFLATALVSGDLAIEAQALLSLVAPEVASAGGLASLAAAEQLIASLPLELLVSLRELVLSPESLSLALLSAHMIIFWLSQDSNVTPPVCLAAFTAAAIAKSPPMATGFASWKLAKGLYIMPILFALTPILASDWLAALQVAIFALVGIYALAACMQGWLELRLNPGLRLLCLALGIACLWPQQLLVNALGSLIFLALLGWQVYRLRHT